MCTLGPCIGMFQILILKLSQRRNFLCSCSPRSQAACLELHWLVSKLNQDLGVISWSFGLWAGQMEPLGRELFRASPHYWPNWLKSWTEVDLRALLSRAGSPFPQLYTAPSPDKKPNTPKPLREYLKLTYPDLHLRGERWTPSHYLMVVVFRKVYVAVGLSFCSVAESRVSKMHL